MSRSTALKNTTASYEGDKIAHMICERFRAAGACEAVQGLSDLFNIRLQSDDVQDFDVRWDQALLSASEMPSDVILEGLYKSKKQHSVQLHTVDQPMRTRNFRVRNEVVERGSVTKSQKRKESPR